MPEPLPFRLLSALLLLLLSVAIPAAAQGAFSRSSKMDSVSIGEELHADLSSASLPQISDQERAETLLVRQRYQAAIQAFMKIESPSALVWNEMGMSYQMLYDYKDAMRCYKASLNLKPNDPNVLNNQATVQDGLRDFRGAEKTYRKALKLEPNSPLILKNLGTNLLMQHKYEEGSAAYKRALLLDPHIFEDHGSVRMNDPAPTVERGTAAYFKARSCARAGLWDCAITFLRKAMNEGFTVEQVSREQDFAPLRTTESYANLISLEQ